jgi:hypothetical protein
MWGRALVWCGQEGVHWLALTNKIINFGFHKNDKYLDQLSDYHLLKKNMDVVSCPRKCVVNNFTNRTVASHQWGHLGQYPIFNSNNTVRNYIDIHTQHVLYRPDDEVISHSQNVFPLQRTERGGRASYSGGSGFRCWTRRSATVIFSWFNSDPLGECQHSTSN